MFKAKTCKMLIEVPQAPQERCGTYSFGWLAKFYYILVTGEGHSYRFSAFFLAQESKKGTHVDCFRSALYELRGLTLQDFLD